MNIFFGKTTENVRKHRDIKLVTTDKRKTLLVSEPNYHTPKWSLQNLLVIEMKKKTKGKMNKPVYLGFSILEISKTLIYEFVCNYIKPNIKTMQNYVIWILAALLFRLNLYFYKNIADDVVK